MADADNGGSGSPPCSSSVTAVDKGKGNKRKLNDPTQGNPISLQSSLAEFPRYGSSLVRSQNPKIDLGSSVVGFDKPKEELVSDDGGESGWDHPMVLQIEQLLTSNLHTLFKNAIGQIVKCGYSEEEAEKSLSRSGIYCGGKDLVSNIVNDTLAILTEEKEIDASRDCEFENLQQMAQFAMVEMVGVLREVKPSLSVGEAMWLLLVFDLNIAQLCPVEGDQLSGFGGKEDFGESSSDSLISLVGSKLQVQCSKAKVKASNSSNASFPDAEKYLPETLRFGSFPQAHNLKGLRSYGGLTAGKESTILQEDKKFEDTTRGSCKTTSTSAEKRGTTWVHNKKELSALHQKAIHAEKYRACRKAAFRSGKLSTFSESLVAQNPTPPSELHRYLKKAVLNISKDGVKGRPASTKTSASSSLPATNISSGSSAKPMLSELTAANDARVGSSSSVQKPTKVSEANASVSSEEIDYYARIPYDKTLGKYVPQDEKDELIVKLVPQLQELQNEQQSWTNWANEKVMQATQSIRKAQAEMKLLRQEKEELEQFKKEKQILEENAKKRLSEMEYVHLSATSQFEEANSTIEKLESENSAMKKEMEAAKEKAIELAANCQIAFERELKMMKDAQSWDGQKGLLQEELEGNKKVVAVLQKKVEKAKDIHKQTEARWKLEKMAKEKLLEEVASIRKEREQIEAAGKEEEAMILKKAETEAQKYKEDIKKLETSVAELKLTSESSRIAALRSEFWKSKEKEQALKGRQKPDVSERAVNSPNKFDGGALKREWECVMCLSEQTSVVFLPCAHQVLCVNCNDLHEKQGMKDCPCCRTLVQWRIVARFARS